MTKIKRDVVKNWLDASFRNQTWLANEMGYSKGYVSQILKCDPRYKLGITFLERLCEVTHIPMERVSISDGQRNEWMQIYDESFTAGNKTLSKKAFYKLCRREFSYA